MFAVVIGQGRRPSSYERLVNLLNLSKQDQVDYRDDETQTPIYEEKCSSGSQTVRRKISDAFLREAECSTTGHAGH